MKKGLKWVGIFLALTLFAGSAWATEQPIAKIIDFSGKIVVCTQGKWGQKITKGMPLYSGDKILTTDSTATVRFNDRGLVEVRPYSNLRIIEENNQRDVRVYVGKIAFKTAGPKAKIKTRLVSPTAVAALRGTAGEFGYLEGETVINLTEGEFDATGKIVEGSVPEVTIKHVHNNRLYTLTLKLHNFASVQKGNNDTVSLGGETLTLKNLETARDAAKMEIALSIETVSRNPDDSVVLTEKTTIIKNIENDQLLTLEKFDVDQFIKDIDQTEGGTVDAVQALEDASIQKEDADIVQEVTDTDNFDTTTIELPDTSPSQ